MEFLIDLRFEDKKYNAVIHFVATFKVKDENEAKLFIAELEASLKRKELIIYPSTYERIDHDPLIRERRYEYYEFCKSRATALIQIEQFILGNPDQNKSLAENLTERVLNGEDSTALIGKKYKIPVRVSEKNSRNPISGEIYYFALEHLIPKKQE